MNNPVKTFIAQKDQSDCGVACLANVIAYYEDYKSLEYLRDISGTTRQGTTMLGLYQAAQKCSLKVEGKEAGLEWLKNISGPVILHVLIDNRLQHFVVCYGWQKDHFIIGDPGKGIIKMSETELENIWKFKALLTFEPTEDFEKKEETQQVKKKWFISLVKEDYGLLTIILFLSLATAVLGMTMAIFSQKLVDELLPSKNTEKLFLGLGLFTFLLLTRGFVNYLSGFFNITQGRDFNNRIIDRFYNSLMFLPKSFFDTRRVGELVARMNDTARIQSAITAIAGELIRSFLLVIEAEVVIFIYAPMVGFFTLASIPVFAWISWRYHKKIGFCC
jgi:ATP-binding cassette, subfamily C, bacteriocin exporter